MTGQLGLAIDSLLNAAVDRGDVPGVSALITDRDKTIHQTGFGLAGPDGGDMTTDTVCWIASMTKPLTAVAAMQLVEQGRLSLDAPAAEILPQLAAPNILEGMDENGSPRLRPARNPITLRQLLTHTSGLAYEMWHPGIRAFLKATGVNGMFGDSDDTLDLPLIFEPGTGWEYGQGIDFAGRMVEQVTGQRLGDYLHDHVLAPLGMDSTAFRITDDMRARKATVYGRQDDGHLVARPEVEVDQNPKYQGGGGGLYGTVSDYGRFMRMILNRGLGPSGPVLQPDTVAMMSRNQMGPHRVHMLKSVVPAMTNDAEFFPGIEKTWGLSFMINEVAAPTGRSAGSLAWAGLTNCYFWIDPAREIAGAYMTQILPFADTKSLPLFLSVEKAVYDWLDS